MLYEYKGRVYIKVGNKYIQVEITQRDNGEYDVKTTNNREYVEKMPNATTIPLEKAYKLSKKEIMQEDSMQEDNPREPRSERHNRRRNVLDD